MKPAVTRRERLLAFAAAFATCALLFGSIGGLAEHYASAGAPNALTSLARADRVSPRKVAQLNCANP